MKQNRLDINGKQRSAHTLTPPRQTSKELDHNLEQNHLQRKRKMEESIL
jgi:hypothetical protein